MKIECKTHGNVCWKLKRKFMDDIKMHFPQTNTFECLLFRIIFEFYFVVKENALIALRYYYRE